MSEPKITRRAAHDDGDGNLPINRIVIHATCGGRGYPHESEVGVAANTAAYFARKTTEASAHYIVDIEDEQHCVPDANIGWHAPPNAHSIGIEICAEATYTRTEWLSDEVWPAVVKAAARVKELAARYDVPLVRLSPVDLLAGKRGYCAHADVSAAWKESTHTDVGPGFPWDEWAKLLGAPAPKPAPAKPTSKPAPAPAKLPAPGIQPAAFRAQYGETSDNVKRLQQFLARNYPAYKGEHGDLPATGFYGDITTAWVLEFAQRSRIPGADGRNVGPQIALALARAGFLG